MTEYRIPNSRDEKQWAACLILSYKTIKGFEYDDRDWDKIHWARTAKSAKLLLSVCKNLRTADTCLCELGEKFNEEGFTWTFETILRHSTDWMLSKRGKDENRSRQRFLNAIAQQKTKGLDAQHGELAPPQPILNTLRSVLGVPKLAQEANIRRTERLDGTLLGPILENETDGD